MLADCVLAMAAAIADTACNRPGRAEHVDPPRVAFVMKTLNHPFFLDMKRGADDAAGKPGVDLVVQAAEREVDVERQMQIIENLIETRRAGALRHPERIAGDRLRARQGEPRGNSRGRGRHAREIRPRPRRRT